MVIRRVAVIVAYGTAIGLLGYPLACAVAIIFAA